MLTNVLDAKDEKNFSKYNIKQYLWMAIILKLKSFYRK